MKILLLANKGSNHAKKVAEGLADRGHEIVFVSPNDYEDVTVSLNNRVKLMTLPYGGKKGYFLNAIALRTLYNKVSPDIVNVHYASGCGLLGMLAGLRPTVLSCYGSDIFEFPHLNRINMWLLRHILKNADALASTSYAMAAEIKRLISIDEKKISITPFGINTKLFVPRHRVNKRKVIGIIKTLSSIYDIPLLIQAFRLICNKRDDTLLRIYGEGPQKVDLQKMTNDLDLSTKVEFKGRIPNNDVPQALNEMDVFVNCSKQESFGVNILEAMACGIPVVATDCVGPREIIIDGGTGIIVKDRDPQSLADAINCLLDNDYKRAIMGEAGRRRVCDFYDWANNVILLEKVLYENHIK